MRREARWLMLCLVMTAACSGPTLLDTIPSVHFDPGAAYHQEVGADERLGHWRLDGSEEGALKIDLDRATRFGSESFRALLAPRFGGGAFTVEAFVRDVQGGALFSYATADQTDALTIECALAGVSVTLLGQQIQTPVQCPANDRWAHMAVTWRGQSGALSVHVDGWLVWEGEIKTGQSLPFGGVTVLGQRQGCLGGCFEGGFVGVVDEVVLHDRALPATRLLSHVLVAAGERPPTPINANLPERIQIQSGHTGNLASAVFSPDGGRLAMGDLHGIIEVRDVATGRLVHAFDQHTGIIQALAFTPDGRRLVSAGWDKTLRVWDMDKGELLHTLKGHTERITSLLLSRDGRLAVSSDTLSTRIWRLNDGSQLHDMSLLANLKTLVFSPTGHDMAVVRAKRRVKVFDALTGAVRFIIKRGDLPEGVVFSPRAVRFSPDGQRLIVEGMGARHVFDALTGELFESIDRGTGAGAWLGTSPDGRWGAAATSDEISLWRLDSDEASSVWPAAGGGRAVFSPDGRLVALDQGRGKLVCVELATGRALFEADSMAIEGGLAFSPDGRVLVYGDNAKVHRAVEVETGRVVQEVEARGSYKPTARFTPDGRRLVTDSGGVRVWDADTGQLEALLALCPGQSARTDIDPKGRWIAAQCPEGPVKLFDVRSGEVVREIDAPKTLALDFDSKGRRLLTTESTRAVVWNLETGAQEAVFGEVQKLRRAVFCPDGDCIMGSQWRGDHFLWDRETGERRTIEVLGEYPSDEAWDPRGQHYALVDYKGGLRVWDVNSGRLVQNIKDDDGGLRRVFFDRGGFRMVTASTTGALKVWNPRTGSRRPELRAHRAQVNGVSFSLLGREMASVGDDRRLVVWSDSGEILNEFVSVSPLTSVDYSSDGYRVAASGQDGATRVWNLSSRQVVAFVAEGERWISYTEGDEGFFVASPDGGSLVALVQGDRVFGIDKGALTLNRPDKLIEALGGARILDIKDEKRAIRWLNASGLDADTREARLKHLKLLSAHYKARYLRRLKKAGLTERQARLRGFNLPRARILSATHEAAAGLLHLEMDFKDTRGLVGHQIYVNDVPVYSTPKPLKGLQAIVRARIELTAGINKVEVSALGLYGRESPRALTQVEQKQAPPGRLVFVGFGVSDYQHNDQIPDLKYAHQDVLDLAETFRAHPGAQVHIFTDDEVTPANIKRARALIEHTTVHDTLVLFVAGHGVRDMKDEAHTYYYLPHGARLDDLEETAVKFDAIEALLYDSKPRKKLFLMDTCQSGEVDEDFAVGSGSGGRGLKARSVPLDARTATVFGADFATKSLRPETLDRARFIYMDLARRSGAIVISSSRGREYSLEGPQFENGAFTEEILNALRTDVADLNNDDNISTDELRSYVLSAVPKLTEGRQHPTVDRDNLHQKFSLPIKAP